MNIWLVKVGEPIPIQKNIKKMRTLLLAEHLVGGGHSVVWWTSAFDHFSKQWLFPKDTTVSINEQFRIIALRGRGYHHNISLARILDHRILASKFKALAPAQERPDCIIVALPPHDLAYEVVHYAKNHTIPVFVDIRDPWPDLFLDSLPSIARPLARFALRNDFRMTRVATQNADGLIGATKTFLDWGLKYANRDRSDHDAVFYLGGQQSASNGADDTPWIQALRGKFVVTFIGTFGRYHNPSVLVEAARILRQYNIHFVIAGNGHFFRKVKENAAGLHNITLPGWLNDEAIGALLRASHVGVCPTSTTVSLVPNKVFSYLSAGIPILSAFSGELEDLLVQHHIGFRFPPNRANILAQHILTLYNDSALYQEMSEQAKRLFAEQFDQAIIYQQYMDHIQEVVDSTLSPNTEVLEERKIREREYHNQKRNESQETTERSSYLLSQAKWYSVNRKSTECYEQWLTAHVKGKRVLDYGCGNGEASIQMAQLGAQEVYGIDISDLSVENGKKDIGQKGLSQTVKLIVADAEHTPFENDYFDIMFESGVLHHLDLSAAYKEIARVLKPSGKAICHETLGHNPLIHAYRKRTPHLRTSWEVDHILHKKDVELAKQYFNKVEILGFFHLASIAAVFLNGTSLFGPTLRILEIIDSVLLRIPFIQWQAWQVIFVLSEPKKNA